MPGCCCASATCRAPRATRARCSRPPTWRRPSSTESWRRPSSSTPRPSRASSIRPRASLTASAWTSPRAPRPRPCCASPAGACVSRRNGPDEALDDMLAAGRIVSATGSTCPGYLAWRSGAALAHLALGEHEDALRLATEEVELARAFGGLRTLGVSLRTAGVVAGGAEGEALLRESVACLERAGDSARTRAGAGRARGAGARGRPALAGAPDAAPGARRGPPRGRGAAGRPRRSRATGHRRQAAPGGPERGRGAHGQRAARGRAGGRRPHQPRDRSGAVRDHADRRGSPDARLRQLA